MSKYNDLYNSIKNEITSGQIEYGGKLPSVRKASAIYSLSRTTVQNAYFALAADGYIISEPQSGYYVSYKTPKANKATSGSESRMLAEYDFNGTAADGESFDFDVWRRHIKAALRQDQKLLTYSEPKGEKELRAAISEYIREKRNVTASPDRIIIGAGVQSLLFVLTSLLKKGSSVSFPDKSFKQGAAQFEDAGFDVHYRYKDADIIYVSPSHMTRWGDVMPNKRRIELVSYSAAHGSIVIEDDYESDFQYNSRPTPSLHALAAGSNVVYIGSFSRLLLPSIRISFMVLTEELAQIYNNNIYKFSQTASKTEQIALCGFIRDGYLASQTRKTRRFYTVKTKKLKRLLENEFKDDETKIEISENSLQIIMRTKFNCESDIFIKNGISVFIESLENGIITLVLNPTSIPDNKLEDAVKALKKATLN